MIFVIAFVLVSSFKAYCPKFQFRSMSILSIFSFNYLGYADAGSYKLPPTSEPVNTTYHTYHIVAVCFCREAFGLRGLSTCRFFKVRAIFSTCQTKNVTHLIKLFVLCSFILKASISLDLCSCHIKCIICTQYCHASSLPNSYKIDMRIHLHYSLFVISYTHCFSKFQCSTKMY